MYKFTFREGNLFSVIKIL